MTNPPTTPINSISTRLRERARWLESRSFSVLDGEVEREAADVIDDLWKRLLRADPSCETMHHEKSEYHKFGEPCPVEAWVRKDFYNKTDE